MKQLNRAKLTYNNLLYFIAQLLPLIYFVYYFSLCIHYYKQRFIYSDNSYFLYTLIHDENFAIFHHRWVGVLSQWLPLLCIKLSCSLKFVIIAYSVNVALIYFIIYLVIAYYFKRNILALIIIVLTGLLQHYSFFWQVSELTYGSSILVLFMLLITEKISIKNFQLFLILNVFIVLSLLFIHPLFCVIMVLFSLILFIHYRNKKCFSLFFIAIFGLVIKTIFLSGFESSKIQGFNTSLFTIHQIKVSYLFYYFKYALSNQFYIIKIALIILSISLLVWKKFFLLAGLVCTTIILFLLTYYYIPNGETVAYMETYFMVILIIPIFFSFLLLYEHFNKFKYIITIVVCSLSIYGLYKTKSEKLFKQRTVYLENILKENKGKLLYIEKGEIKENLIMVAWALPYETLILSSLNGISASIYYNDNNLDIKNIKDSSIFLGANFQQYQAIQKINNNYFNIKPQFYHKINALNF